MEDVFQAPQVAAGRGSETMLAPQEVQRMLALSAPRRGSRSSNLGGADGLQVGRDRKRRAGSRDAGRRCRRGVARAA